MKTYLLALLLATAVCSCNKSNTAASSPAASTIPAAVTTNFNVKYPSATGQIEWEKEDGNTYKVKFYQGTQRWQAMFRADGSFISESQL